MRAFRHGLGFMAPLVGVVSIGLQCGTGSRPFGGDDGGGGGSGVGGGGGQEAGGAAGSMSSDAGASGTGGAVAGRGGGSPGGRGGGGRQGGRGGIVTGGNSGTAGAAGSAPGGSPCPTAAPTSTACAAEGLICEYGQDPRPECRGRATCANGNWMLTEVRCVAIPPATGGCPATRDTAQGRPCGPDAALCSYGGLNCLCASCAPNGPVSCAPNPATLAWYCDTPHVDPLCPAVLPRLGAACPNIGKQCTYSCGNDGARVCRGGVWAPADGGGCPRSSRQVKRDIHYLGPTELEDLARDVTRLRLATWQYKDPALAGRRHLGFIIEDQPNIAAVDSGRGMVDLYGYTSMLAAAVKAQQNQITALRREVEALRARPLRARRDEARRRR